MSASLPSGIPPNPSDGQKPFFVAGGTMEPKAASYVERKADHELYEAMLRGEFCYVLTSRQMGKSSLFSRAAYRLRQQGIRISFFDLSSIGTNVTVDQWFDGMLERIGADFDLEEELDEFRKRSHLGPNQMWLEVLRRVLLAKIPGRITIIVDEIDLVRSLAFPTDEFFIGIRELYNRRSQDPELRRLSFCLLGVASPATLIANKEITPFNIGRRIELRDFTEQEALRLADGITNVPAHQAEALVQRVFHWTSGQPYLTQKICEAVAARPGARDAAAVDAITEELFLTQRARETEPNLTFVRDRILSERRNGGGNQSLEELLRLYRRIWRGARVDDSEVAPEVSRLKLSGLVRGEHGRLVVKNLIYRANFDKRWVREQLPRDWARIPARTAALAANSGWLRRVKSVNWAQILARTAALAATALLLACLPLVIWTLARNRAAVTSTDSTNQPSKVAISPESRGRVSSEPPISPTAPMPPRGETLLREAIKTFRRVEDSTPPANTPIPPPESRGLVARENSLGMKFVPIEGGAVLYSVWETRVGDFARFVKQTDYSSPGAPLVQHPGGWTPDAAYSWKAPGYPQTDEFPVVDVSWDDAVKFCEWLTAMERLSGRIRSTDRYRLPTDVEWSVAAGLRHESGNDPVERMQSSFKTRRYIWGRAWPPPAGVANIMNTKQSPSTVGSYPLDSNGLADLCGNATEWCEDRLGDTRFLRGGAWYMESDESEAQKEYQVGYRFFADHACKRNYIGFRVVLDVGSDLK